MGRRRVFHLFFFVLFFGWGSFFNDPFYPVSWYLHNIDEDGVSINAPAAWEFATGKGITLGFGLHAPFYLNEELVDRLNESATSSSESPNYVKTGVISAAIGNADNQFCSVGVAYEASYAILGNQDSAFWLEFLDLSPAVDIYVIDFSGSDRPDFNMACAECWKNTRKVVNRGGVVISRAGGGGSLDNCNYDQYANSPDQLIVGAHTPEATPFDFTEPCSAVLFSAPGGSSQKGIWVETEIRDSVSTCEELSGTQLAVGIAAGVVALVREATENKLSSREIAHVLVSTARTVPDFTKNGAGLSFHERLGFGMLDAGKAVKLAKKAAHHPLIVPQKDIFWNSSSSFMISDMKELSVKAEISAKENVLVDYVILMTDIKHSYAGDLAISLTSPAGTTSVMSLPRASVDSEAQKLEIFHSIEKTFPMFALNNAAVSIPNEQKMLKYDNVVFVELQGFSCCAFHRCSTSIEKENEGNFFYILLLKTGPCEYFRQLATLFSNSQSVLPQMVLVENAFENDFYAIDGLNSDIPILSLSSSDFLEVQASALSSLVDLVSVSFFQKYTKQSLSFKNWDFTTTKNWNEQAAGKWTVTIKDSFPEDSGFLNTLALTLQTFILSNKNHAPLDS